MIMKDGDQDFSTKLIFERLPVNIEKTRINRRLAILKNVKPPGVIAAHDAHVIGNDVENQSHAAFVESGDKAIEVFRGADFGIEGIVIYDVVSVHAAGAGLEARRNVAMTDSKIRQIGNDLSCLREGEVAIELQAIGRARNM